MSAIAATADTAAMAAMSDIEAVAVKEVSPEG
jgi:hypothetical protein